MDELSDIPPVDGDDLKRLRGLRWRLDGDVFHIPDAAFGHDGLAIRGGGEAFLVPLLDGTDTCRWFLKIFHGHAASSQRRARAEWLSSQRLHNLMPELHAAPRRWIDTRVCGRPDGFSCDFAGYLATPIVGQTWLEYKLDVSDGIQSLTDECRLRWAKRFLRVLAGLERRGIVHGDLSDNNVLVNAATGTLHLIDFDAYFAPNAPAGIRRLSSIHGGTVGTPDYMPVDLQQRHRNGEPDLSPYSDRRARDLLLLEILCFDADVPAEDGVSVWDRSLMEHRLKAARLGPAGRYFERRELLDLPEQQRVSSRELATAMQVSQPPMTVIHSGHQAASDDAPESVTSKAALRLRDALWSISMALWFLLALTVHDWVKQQSGSDGFHNSISAWCAGIVTFALGGWWTSRTAYGSETPTLCQIGPLLIRIPACETGFESPLVRQPLVLARLAIGVTFLTAAALLV